MTNYYQPTWICQSIIDISIPSLVNQHINTLLIDLDNTLVDPKLATLSEKIKHHLEELSKSFNIYIISNSNPHRVQQVLGLLPLPFLGSAHKPSTKRIEKFLLTKQIVKETSVIIGDQLLTDIWLANRLKIRSIVVEPLVPWDLKRTWINRQIDIFIRKKIHKDGTICKK